MRTNAGEHNEDDVLVRAKGGAHATAHNFLQYVTGSAQSGRARASEERTEPNRTTFFD